VTPDRPLRIGTRGSALALWQTERVRAELGERGQATERIEIRTTGDVVVDRPLSRIGTMALFTKQLDDALLEHRIDLAVHSLKDLPTVLPWGIAIAAVSVREDPRDALVGRSRMSFAALPPGATVATSSLRRRAQLLRARPDLEIVDVRGNVDTRLAKLESSGWAAIVLASAGLVRLGLDHRIGERLDPELMLPAPGQGALAVTVRADDGRTARVVRAAIHDERTAICVAAERAFLRRLEGGCQVPVAALATIEGDHLRLRGRIASLDGRLTAEGEDAGTAEEGAADALGRLLADTVHARGGAEILAEVRATAVPVVPEP
jgi:hydroxymethylbilane synthase